MGFPAPYALLSSAISMIGGHGAAGAYGRTFEELGYAGAMGVGAAAATFGLISGVMVEGPLARRLIVRYNLKPQEDNGSYAEIESINAAEGVKLMGLETIQNGKGMRLKETPGDTPCDENSSSYDIGNIRILCSFRQHKI